MYEAFYGFREKPFNLTPDPKYLYLSEEHGEAFAHLEFGLKQRGGFVVITGEVGTGKTTLCRYFLERLDENTISAFILYPALSAVELLQSICEDLGIRSQGTTGKEWVDILHRFLLESREAGKNIVLVIDESQNLDPEVLEQIRLISNLETTTEKLIQIVLIGQSELNDLLSQTGLRQLAQRVTARYHLQPLNRKETISYLRHRLEVAGGAGKVSFTARALRAIHRFSKGTPRLINLICDRTLLAGFVAGRREVDAKIVGRAAKELGTTYVKSGKTWQRSWGIPAAVAAVLLAVLALSFRPESQRLLPWTSAKALEEEEAPEANRGEEVATEGESSENVSRISVPEALESRLQTLSGGLSRRAAARSVLLLWGAPLGGNASSFSPLEDLSSMGRRSGFEVTELRTHFDQLRQLNLPAVLELFHPTRSDTCYAALIRLGDDSADISFSPGDEMGVPLAFLERFWTNRAYVFWKDFEGLGAAPSQDSRSSTWIVGVLLKLGYLSDQDETSTESVRDALARFQDSTYLAADSVAGPKTRMALYSLSSRYSLPRLDTP
jgi:general secretion pathway protein A